MATCPTCHHEHPTTLEELACDEVNRPPWSVHTAGRRAQLNATPDDAWRAAVDMARRRRHPRTHRRVIWRVAAAVAAFIGLGACTPAQIQWWTATVRDAEQAGHRCPDLAPARKLAGLPDGFDYIIWRESRCTPTAVNSDSGALGLTQIMPQWIPTLCGLDIACTRADLLDAHTNLAAAAYVFSVQGWQAWAT